MSVLWNKVWFDLWHNKGRTMLVVLSIASGVFTIGAIFGMIDQMLAGMDAAHQSVQPSHANIILRGALDGETVNELKEVRGVAGIEPVNQLSIRYKSSPDGEWELGTLIMRSDYAGQTYDQLNLVEGSWPVGEEIAVERLTVTGYGFGLGEEVILDVDGEERQFTINGVIRHPFVQPPPFGGQAHFFTSAAGMALFGIPEGRYGQLLVRVEPYSLERSKEIAAEIRSRLAERGIGVVVTLYQDPERHWGRKFVEGIYLVLQVMAFVSLVLSVVLVMNTLSALITQQTDQLGVIKAIGGRRSVVLKTYLSGVLVYGLLALILAVPLGALFAFGLSRWFLNLFNIDTTTFQVSQRAVWFQIISATLVPLLAALPPVLRGARITVRQAIASYGLGGDFGSSRFDRLIERTGARFLSTPYAVALGNTFRRKARMSLTVMVLSMAGAMFLILMSLIASIQLTLDNEQARRGYDIRIGVEQAQSAERLAELAQGVDGVQAVEVWIGRNATLLSSGERLEDSAGLGAQLIGLPPGSDMVKPLITAGRWLRPGDDRAIVISQETANKNNIDLGDRVVLDLGDLGDSEWEVVGTYKVVYDTGFVIEPVYAPLQPVYEATGISDLGTQVYIQGQVTDLESANDLFDRLVDTYEAGEMSVDFYTSSISIEERGYANNQFSSVVIVLLNLALLVASVGMIGLTGALAIGVVERRREIGVMRAVGAPGRTISSLFVFEGILQGLISWFLALPIAFLLSRPLATQLGQTMLDISLDFAFDTPAIFYWLVAVLLISAVASIWPARSAARISVRENLAYT